MQTTPDNVDDPGVRLLLDDQRFVRQAVYELAVTPPVVEFARTADGASVAAVVGDDVDEDPLVWVARPLDAGIDPVPLSSVGPVTRITPRSFPSALDWRNAVPTIAEP